MTSRVPFWLASALALVALVVGLLLAPLAPWAEATPGEQSAEAGFARDMRAHHAQAVAMSVLAFDRTEDPEVRAVAMDIATSQQAQIGMMGAWLEQWGLRPSGTEPPMAWMGHALPAGERMPGMASPQQMSELSQARGDGFDRTWARLMHAHHSGGIPMTEEVIARTDREPVRALAEGIRDSQAAELSVLEQIAVQAGGDVDDVDAHAGHG